MKSIILTSVLALISGSTLSAPEITFEETRHNFGEVKEERGVVRHTFHFTNTGDEPLRIYDVKSSCTCTSPGFTTEEIMPGERGYVVAEYDPANTSGKFLTSLPVSTNDPENETILLRVAGEVIPRTRKSEEIYSHEFGSLRSRTPNFYLGEFDDNTAKGFSSFGLYNSSDQPITISKLEGPDHIQFENKPVTISPGTEEQVRVTYNATAKNDYGHVFDQVTLHTDDPLGAQKTFYLSAQIVVYYDESDPDNPPKLKFDQRTHNFGTISMGEVVSKKFTFTNAGKKDLHIHRVLPGCHCTASDPEKSILKPGEASYIEVTFDSAGRPGNNNQSVRVYTNDPVDPVQNIRITANVTP